MKARSTQSFKSFALLTLFIGGSLTLLSGCQPGYESDFESKSENLATAQTPSALEEQEAQDEAAGSPSNEALDVMLSEITKSPSQNLKVDARNFTPKAQYSHLDPEQIIPRKAFSEAVHFLQQYETKFKNKDFMAIIDFKQKSTQRRFYLVNLKTGDVQQFLVAHGKYSDSNHDGYATQFSNTSGSGQSSLGAYMTAEHYSGKHGTSMRLDGLQATNSNARSRAVVMHEADYVSPNLNPIGRSLGCPAVEPRYRQYLLTSLKAGALIYASY